MTMTQAMRDERSKHREAGSAFAITVAFEIEVGTYETFHRLVSENARESVSAEAGCIRFDVLTPLGADEAAEVLLYEIYSDRAAFDHHLATDHFKRFDEATRHLVRKKTVVAFAVAQNSKSDSTP